MKKMKKTWYERNKKRILKRQKEYYKKNRKKINARMKKYYRKNKEWWENYRKTKGYKEYQKRYRKN